MRPPSQAVSSMQKPNTSSCPTITCEEALRRELEFRKRLERTHPHLLWALNGDPVLPKLWTDSTPDVLRRNSAPDSNMSSLRPSHEGTTVQRQQANWYPPKKKVKVQLPPSQVVQSTRPNLVPSFWCKICKVDCVTVFNFNSHIGGKKHKAKKLEILGNRTSGRPASQCVGNRNPGPNDGAVFGSRNDEQNVCSSSIAEPSSDTSSGSRTNGAIENVCSAPFINSLQFSRQSVSDKDILCLFSSEMQIDIFSAQTNKETSSDELDFVGPSN